MTRAVSTAGIFGQKPIDGRGARTRGSPRRKRPGCDCRLAAIRSFGAAGLARPENRDAVAIGVPDAPQVPANDGFLRSCAGKLVMIVGPRSSEIRHQKYAPGGARGRGEDKWLNRGRGGRVSPPQEGGGLPPEPIHRTRTRCACSRSRIDIFAAPSSRDSRRGSAPSGHLFSMTFSSRAFRALFSSGV